jgi:hydrophobic/amphiphilic exporter-1 (mainly G- bacteria), HAE1 family
VVGGQSLCLLLTLLAVPVFYSLFEDMKEVALFRKWSLRPRSLRPRAAAAVSKESL